MMEVDAGTVANAPIVAAEISSILTNDTLAVRFQDSCSMSVDKTGGQCFLL